MSGWLAGGGWARRSAYVALEAWRAELARGERAPDVFDDLLPSRLLQAAAELVARLGDVERAACDLGAWLSPDGGR